MRGLVSATATFIITITMASSSLLSATASSNYREHTTRPMVTGTSVVGVVYQGGVLLAADTLLSYGSMAKSQQAQRLHTIGNSVVVGASGEYSDYTKLLRILEQQQLSETRLGLVQDGHSEVTAESTWNYLRMLFYSQRNKMNPYWNEMLVAGFANAKADDTTTSMPFLGMVDKIGTTIAGTTLATGFGAWLALPLLREQWRPDLQEGEARALLEDCMRVLFLRDCRASPQIQLAKVTRDETTGNVVTAISDPYILETQWESAEFMRPVADLEGDGGW
jgi:20S proteasome subunit beta 7